MAERKKAPKTIQNEKYFRIKEQIKSYIRQEDLEPLYNFDLKQTSVRDAIRDRETLKNKAMAQDIALKKYTLICLFIFLAVETAVIFLFAYLQGTHLFGFNLEEWSFRLIIAATISQITFMLQVAVKHLFPNQ